jgi:hypothetical protein
MKFTGTTSSFALAIDQDEWVSCSHWGMFPVRQDSSRSEA